MGFLEDFEYKLSSLVGEGRRFKNNAALARYCDLDPSYTHKLTRGSGKKTLEPFGKLLDKLDARLVFPDDNYRMFESANGETNSEQLNELKEKYRLALELIEAKNQIIASKNEKIQQLESAQPSKNEAPKRQEADLA